MKICVSFDNVWSISEVKAFVANPQSPVYSALDKDAYLELAACTECYVNASAPLTDEEMNAAAKSSIANSMSEYFFDSMCDNYIADCIDTIQKCRTA